METKQRIGRGRPATGRKAVQMNVCISRGVKEMLDRYAALRETSRSGALDELLRQIQPELLKSCEALEAAKGNPAQGVDQSKGKPSDKKTALAI